MGLYVGTCNDRTLVGAADMQHFGGDQVKAVVESSFEKLSTSLLSAFALSGGVSAGMPVSITMSENFTPGGTGSGMEKPAKDVIPAK